MTATHGAGEVRVVVLAEVRDFLIKSLALFIGHGIHAGYVFFMGAITSSFGLPMLLYCCFFFFGRHCIPYDKLIGANKAYGAAVTTIGGVTTIDSDRLNASNL